ncbi:MAG TPA: hypothetical protein VF606_07355, partial [Geminicoccaceae bacterium]
MSRESRLATDPDEIEKFAALADTWWDAAGPMAPLHRLNPVRIAYIRDQACTRLLGGRASTAAPRPL